MRGDMTETRTLVDGAVADGYEPVREAFDLVVREREAWSGAVAAYLDGEPVADLWGGPHYARDSLQCLLCTTKCASALCIALLVERGRLDLDERVATYWPEFAAAGKHAVTVRQALSHQAGLIAIDGGCTMAEFLAHEPIAARLAQQRPYWPPGTAHGYHAGTLGIIMDELVRRIVGVSIGEFYRRELQEPYGIDLYLGLPESEEPRVVPFRGGISLSPDMMVRSLRSTVPSFRILSCRRIRP